MRSRRSSGSPSLSAGNGAFLRRSFHGGARSRAGKNPSSYPQRAQEIAAQVGEALHAAQGVSRVEAVKGYLNLYFDTREYARRVVDAVLEEREVSGQVPPKGSA